MACGDASLPGFLLTALGSLDAKYVTMIDDAVFMCNMREYLIQDMLIDTYRDAVAANLAKALGYMSTVIITIWVAYQGFTIIGGTNKEPILPLVYKSAKIVLVMALVTLISGQSPAIANAVLDFQALITAAIVGEGNDVYQIIDINLALAQVFHALIDGLVGGQQAGASGKELTTMAGLVGQSGPAMLVSVLAIMAEISITLAIMLAPLFVFFLLFQQTAAMFWTWVKFLLGTMVSLAVLALLSGILLKMMMFYGATVLAAFYLNAAAAGLVSVDIGGSAMRMASMGALASALIMLVPPLIMQFFNSGASFATGAMMGMMGGGAAGGAMSLAKQLGNQGEGAAGGQGAPGGIGYSGAGGDSSASSETTRMALGHMGKAMGRDAGGEATAGGGIYALNGQGTRGLANQSTNNSNLHGLRQTQGSQEFRNDSSYGSGNSSSNGGYAGTKNNREAATRSAEDAVDTSKDNSLGKGGHLQVDGDRGSVGGGKLLADASTRTARMENASRDTTKAPIDPCTDRTSIHARPDRIFTASNAMPRGSNGRANTVT
jgi:type IV secretion system protein VirB6